MKYPESPRVCIQTRVCELCLPRSRHRWQCWQVPKQSPGFLALLSLAAHHGIFPTCSQGPAGLVGTPLTPRFGTLVLFIQATNLQLHLCLLWGRLSMAPVSSISQRLDSRKVHFGILQSFRLVGDCWDHWLLKHLWYHRSFHYHHPSERSVREGEQYPLQPAVQQDPPEEWKSPQTELSN